MDTRCLPGYCNLIHHSPVLPAAIVLRPGLNDLTNEWFDQFSYKGLVIVFFF